ncbi:S8 family serine peptidase [Amycolatopsis keratiniphila]|nr:S8 family serine peptidase [Amycolatopsis keratiniphila]
MVVIGTPGQLVSLEKIPQVRYVEEAITPLRASSASGSKKSVSAACAPVLSGGLALHRATQARTDFSVDGTGVSVGVISDSYNALGGAAAGVAAGELPGAGNPCGRRTDVRVLHESPADGWSRSDEGRAMAEIVHDVAPGSGLMFSTAQTMFETADSMLEMASQGARVTVDDISFWEEPWFQEGPRDQAARMNAYRGTVNFSAAGNYNTLRGQQDVNGYESVFRPTPCPKGVPSGTCHDFDPSSGTDPTSTFAVSHAGWLALQWNEPWNSVRTNFDLYLLRGGRKIAESVNENKITPYESLGTDKTGDIDVVIRRKDGADTPRLRFCWFTHGARPTEWDTSRSGDTVGVTTLGAVGPDTFNVAASPDGTSLEDFSSRGPSTHYWAPARSDGHPADALPASTQHLPESTAADNVETSFFGEEKAGHFRFSGTSAAAPHAAAIAALALSRNPHKSAADIRTLLITTARPMPGAEPRASGAGFLDAYNVVDQVGTPPTGLNVTAWGSDNFGQTAVPAGLKASAIAAGLHHSLAIEPEGTVVGWGANFYGERSIPAGLTDVVGVAAADVHSVALKRDGTVVAWGASPYGETTLPSGLAGVVSIATGASSRHTLALTQEGTVIAWGSNFYGESTVPDDLGNVTAVAAGGVHSLALRADGTVVGWGANLYGESEVPPGLNDVVAISAGQYRSLALRRDGTVVAWGSYAYQLGTEFRVEPIYVPAGLMDVVAISSGVDHDLALRRDGTVAAWGADYSGQATVPAGLPKVQAIAAGGTFNVALLSQ